LFTVCKANQQFQIRNGFKLTLVHCIDIIMQWAANLLSIWAGILLGFSKPPDMQQSYTVLLVNSTYLTG